jgi:hypothetical protein
MPSGFGRLMTWEKRLEHLKGKRALPGQLLLVMTVAK